MREAFSVFYIVLVHVMAVSLRGIGNVFEGAGGIIHAHWMQVAHRHDKKYAANADDDNEEVPVKKTPKLKSVN